MFILRAVAVINSFFLTKLPMKSELPVALCFKPHVGGGWFIVVAVLPTGQKMKREICPEPPEDRMVECRFYTFR